MVDEEGREGKKKGLTFSQQTRVCARILGIYRASAADLDSYQTQAHEQQGLCLNWWLLSGIEENQARNLYPPKKKSFFPYSPPLLCSLSVALPNLEDLLKKQLRGVLSLSLSLSHAENSTPR